MKLYLCASDFKLCKVIQAYLKMNLELGTILQRVADIYHHSIIHSSVFRKLITNLNIGIQIKERLKIFIFYKLIYKNITCP